MENYVEDSIQKTTLKRSIESFHHATLSQSKADRTINFSKKIEITFTYSTINNVYIT